MYRHLHISEILLFEKTPKLLVGIFFFWLSWPEVPHRFKVQQVLGVLLLCLLRRRKNKRIAHCEQYACFGHFTWQLPINNIIFLYYAGLPFWAALKVVSECYWLKEAYSLQLTTPREASNVTTVPVFRISVACSAPMITGISKERATIAPWEFMPSCSRMMPAALFK